ncbi:DUF2235 domain-containing protein [Niveibacterium sp.]|uniref:T6SS phospholipase effector Tle1-like catalytic domain-containing protein n=1 Tax=Niveibacterium sp. TaxID=2017444 RepID=UPI0035AE9F68
MSVRLAEPCRDQPLSFTKAERSIALQLNPAQICTKNNPAPCNQDIFLSFFFDGTNNNKYRDTPNQAQSNVARLFEACIGTPTLIKPTYGGEADKPDLNGAPTGAEAYYRKTYIPGLGTAFKEIDDSGVGADRTGGLAAALQGEARVVWALLQVTEHLHVILSGGSSIAGAANDGNVARQCQTSQVMVRNLGDALIAGLSVAPPAERAKALARMSARQQRLEVLQGRAKTLEASNPVKTRLTTKSKPKITRIRISVFGFSRGAAEARVFVNWLLEAYGSRIAGIPLQIDFLGVFDTVASVGLAHGVLVADGHMGWADGENMVVPESVRRCVHLAAAHEVRGSFPLDSVCIGDELPSNCKEIIYPGVHSDVGGGYPPHDQGRSTSDADKLSQIPLAQMYREALIAGVPLRLEADLGAKVKATFNISESLKSAFNAYIAATRTGKVAPAGMKDPMFPEETQPAGTVEQIMHKQYGHYLAWRKLRLGNIHAQKNVQEARTGSRVQDIADLKLADEELREELALLNTPVWRRALSATSLLGAIEAAAQQEKFADWGEIRPIWEHAHLTPQNDQAVIELFDRYVHDSRAWFKILASDDADWFDSVGPNGEKKEGELARKTKARIKELEQERAQLVRNAEQLRAAKPQTVSAVGNLATARSGPAYNVMVAPQSDQMRAQWLAATEARIAACDKEIAAYKNGTKTFLNRGAMNHEMYSMWGYLRWRRIYTTGSPRPPKLVYKPVDRAAALKALDQRQRDYMAALRKGIDEARANVQAQNGDLAAFDRSQQYIMEYTSAWMAKERAAI